MKLVYGITAIPAAAVGCVATLGNFDGVHRGHCQIVETTRRLADGLGCPAVVLTFDPHPAKVLRPEVAPPRLTTVEQRAERLLSAGADWVVVIPFDHALSQTSHIDFMREVLQQRLAVRHVVLGQEARFGKGRKGNAATLTAFGQTHGFGVTEVRLLEAGGVLVSSSVIRSAIRQGEIAHANALLGWAYRIDGRVVHGDGRGRQIGVPTANLSTEAELLPADGVYVCQAHLGGATHRAVANIGLRPTFDGTRRTVEVHLLDLGADLYGRELGVTFLAKLRDERRFPDVDALVAQIHRDIDAARDWRPR